MEKETDLADKIDQADLYEIYSALIKIDSTVAAVSKPMSAAKEVATASAPPPTHKLARLDYLNLPSSLLVVM